MGEKTKRSEREFQKAYAAIRYACDAEGEEFLDRLMLVPQWIFAELGECREIIHRLVPVALRASKELAESADDPEMRQKAGERLFQVLTDFPHLQSCLVPEDASKKRKD